MNYFKISLTEIGMKTVLSIDNLTIVNIKKPDMSYGFKKKLLECY